MTNGEITHFDASIVAALRQALARKHEQLAQLDRPSSERTSTARNYDSAILALGDYMVANDHVLPTKGVLEQWRDDMLSGRLGREYAVRTVNLRLAAARKILRGVADDVTDIQIKFVLRDWAGVADAKAVIIQDKLEEDYGIRLTRESLQDLLNSTEIEHVKGLRDRAIIALMSGGGLRISEVAQLTMKDVFGTSNPQKQRGIRVRRGKHNKSRIVVLSGWNSWVLDAVESYTNRLGLTLEYDESAIIVRGVRRIKEGYGTTETALSHRGIQRAVEAYEASYNGKMIRINAHDLRRTYARLCKSYGMSWEALRENMGHSSVKITEDYVGRDVDWSERVPNWSIKLEA